MSRSGYGDWDYCLEDQRRANLYRGTVSRSIRGKRGQQLLRRIVAALDAMPLKELEADTFGQSGGCACTLGALARHEGIDVSQFEPDHGDFETEPVDAEPLGHLLDAAPTLIREIMYANDESPYRAFVTGWHIGPALPPDIQAKRDRERRWRIMRDWCEARIRGVS